MNKENQTDNFNLKPEKLFTYGAIISLIFGLLLYPFLIYANIIMPKDTATADFAPTIIKLTIVIAATSIMTFVSVFQSSRSEYENNHLARALIFGFGSILGWDFYRAQVASKNAKTVKHSLLYGALAVIIAAGGIIAIIWYGSKISGVSIFG